MSTAAAIGWFDYLMGTKGFIERHEREQDIPIGASADGHCYGTDVGAGGKKRHHVNDYTFLVLEPPADPVTDEEEKEYRRALQAKERLMWENMMEWWVVSDPTDMSMPSGWVVESLLDEDWNRASTKEKPPTDDRGLYLNSVDGGRIA